MEEFNLKKKKVTTHNLKKVLPFYAKSKHLMILLIVMLFVGGVAIIFRPIMSANALSNLAQEKFELTIKFAVLTVVIDLIGQIFGYFIDFLHIKINSITRFELTKKVIDSVNRTKTKKLDETKLGALAERLASDVSTVSDSYILIINISFDIITNVIFLCYIAYLNIYFFLILLAYVAVLYIICTIRSRLWIRGKKVTKKAYDEARSAYFEQITGIRDIKLLNIKDTITEYSNKKYQDAINLDVSISQKRNNIRRLEMIISAIFELIFVVFGILFIKKELILLAGFLVIYNYYGRVESLVRFLSNYKEYKAEGEIAATRIFEVINDYEKEEFGSTEIENFSGNIELKNVSFAYNEEKRVLKNINMTFENGKMTAIVGKSGSGKSTILNVISKLYDVNDGKILFDKTSINELTENAIRNNVCEISQSPYIFNTTIRQNLLFSKPDATDDELIEALKKAQIYDDISNMEKGLNTEIGENGVKVSGGQKQRIAIARLLLKENKVIVFDEATSALDNGSQNKIVELLNSLKNDKTIIIVAHRLSTIIGADKIYMLDNGEILNHGTHRELMKNCEEYKNLYELEEKEAKLNFENNDIWNEDEN